MKKISIIIPAYNSGKFIEHCLESIAKQDYDNYEIIVINDASTDITGYKICDFQKKHPNITMQVIYNEQNKGVAASRNIGLKKATGEYLLFVDSDDYLCCNDALSSISEEVTNNDVDVLIFGAIINYTNCNGTSIKKFPIIPKKKDESKKYQVSKKILRYLWPLCIKKDLIERNGIKFQEDLDLYEDTIFTTQAFSHARKIKGYKKICYNYNRRLHRQSLSSNNEEPYLNKLNKLVKATRKTDALVNTGQIPIEQIKDFKKMKRLFFPGIVVLSANHLLSKVAGKFVVKEEENDFDREL